MKRARRFLELKRAGMKPTAAARKVATEWRVDELTVFSDYRRYGDRMLEKDQIESEFLRQFNTIFTEAIEATASKLDSIGNSDAARWAREYKLELTKSRHWSSLFGSIYGTLLRKSRR